MGRRALLRALSRSFSCSGATLHSHREISALVNSRFSHQSTFFLPTQGQWQPNDSFDARRGITFPLGLQQSLGIFTAPSRFLAESEELVRSPLSQTPGPGGAPSEAGTKGNVVKAILKKIKQSPKKVNVVAKLVRGMLVEDALVQMSVFPKRAARYLYKVLHSARANATHNNGLNGDRLVVAEAFVNKGQYTKKIWYHGRGKHGVRTKKSCRITVILKEMTPEQEAERAEAQVRRCRKHRVNKLAPHVLVETGWNPDRNLIRMKRQLASRTIRR